MKLKLITYLFVFLTVVFLSSCSSSIQKVPPQQVLNETCYVGVKTSNEFNKVLLSEISVSLISQYIRQVSPFPSGGLSGSNHCIYEVSVTKDGEKTFVTLQGKDLNSFGESNTKGTDGFKESILRSLYRSQREKRGLICSDYPIKW